MLLSFAFEINHSLSHTNVEKLRMASVALLHHNIKTKLIFIFFLQTKNFQKCLAFKSLFVLFKKITNAKYV